MTGRFPGEVGIHSALPCSGCRAPNGTVVDCGCAGFVNPVAFPTVTNILHENGYKCGHFGKWHMGASENATAEMPLAIVAPSPDATYGLDSSVTFDSNAMLSDPNNARIPLYPDAHPLIPPIHPKNKQCTCAVCVARVPASILRLFCFFFAVVDAVVDAAVDSPAVKLLVI